MVGDKCPWTSRLAVRVVSECAWRRAIPKQRQKSWRPRAEKSPSLIQTGWLLSWGGRATSSEKPSSFLDLNRVKNSQIGGCYLRYVGEVDGDADIQRSRPAFEDLGKAVGWSAGQGRDVCDLSSTTVGFWSSSSGNAIPTLTPNPVPSQSPPTRSHCCRNNPKKPPTSPA